MLARAHPVYVSLSCEVSPEIREYERTSTTVINAYLQPLMDRYLARLARRLAAMGVPATSPNAVQRPAHDLEQARRFPTRLIESGPAGGALAARFGAPDWRERTSLPSTWAAPRPRSP